MNLVPPGLDETVTRQSWDAPALIYWLSAGRAQRLSPAWSETPWQGSSRARRPAGFRTRPSASGNERWEGIPMKSVGD